MSNAKLAYENRLVLFIDFLGFKELIQRTISDSDLTGRIISAMDHIKEITNEADFFKTQRVTQFSDCMVVSYEVRERSAVFDLINDIGFVLVDLAARGFLLRGAVTVGKLIHTHDHLLGPAMVRAHELESQVAMYPRVIVDPDVLAIATANPARHHSGEEEVGYVRSFLREDEDGHHYVDYVSWNGVVATIGAESDDYPHYLGKLARLVSRGLKHSDTRVQEKFLWLHRHYIAAIESFEDTPEDYPGRIENSEMYADIFNLPRLVREATEAKESIARAASAVFKRA